MSTDLAVIEAALKAATPGPWAVCPWYPQGVMPKAWADDQLPVEERGPFMSTGTVGDAADTTTERPEADAHLIANAPDWLAELIERVKAAEAEVERLRRSDSLSATIAQRVTPEALEELRSALDELQTQTVAHAARGRSSMPIKLADVVALMLVAEIVYAEAKGRIDG